MLAKHALQRNDFKTAVEFLVMANQMDQAFDIAQSSGTMDAFAKALAANSKPGDYDRIASYYESRGELEKAGDVWEQGEEWGRAIKLYLRLGTPTAMHKAVGVVEKSGSRELGVSVLEHVEEHVTDGSVKDELRFKLNLALGMLQDAARDACEMARFEQVRAAPPRPAARWCRCV